MLSPKPIQGWLDDVETTKDLVVRWRLAILNGLLWASVILVFPVFINYVFILQRPLTVVPLAYCLLVLCAIFKRTELLVRACIFLALLYIVGIQEIRDSANVGAYRLVFLMLVVYSVLFFGLRGISSFVISAQGVTRSSGTLIKLRFSEICGR